MDKLCKKCGVKFRTYYLTKKFCSKKCLNAYWRKKCYLKQHPLGKLKYWTSRKRNSLGLFDGKLNSPKSFNGVDKIRELVRIRDNYTCQTCGKIWVIGQRRFDVHHLDEKMDGLGSYKGMIIKDKKNIEKMITLCHKCHLGGYFNNKKLSRFL